MAKTEIEEVKTSTAVAGYDYGDMSHEGFEETTIQDLSIPFINIMQTNSEIVEEGLIEGVKPGDLVNSVTNEIMTQPIVVIPVHKEEIWVEWNPRNKGGGILGRYEPESQVVKDILAGNNNSRIPPKGGDGKRIPFKGPEGGEVIETHYVYCLIANSDGTEIESYGVLAFSSTKIKPYKDWMTAMYTIKGRPPMFANRAKLSTVKQKNNDGTFFNFGLNAMTGSWKESLINPATELPMLEEAKDFRDMIMNGLAKPAYETVSGDDSGGDGSSSEGNSGSGSGGKKAKDDGDMPF